VTTVIIPFSGDCPHRLAALDWVVEQWASTGYDVAVSASLDGPWSKGRAVWETLQSLDVDDTETLIVADADVWTSGLPRAIGRVEAGQVDWAMPHTRVVRFADWATAKILNEGVPVTGFAERGPAVTERPYTGTVGGGMTVLTVGAYRACPIDPRFHGWGQEDESWGMALTQTYGRGPRSVDPMWHLWHPTPERRSRVEGNAGGVALRNRYRAARGNDTSMGRLLREALVALG
jgi:hypothetical protein